MSTSMPSASDAFVDQIEAQVRLHLLGSLPEDSSGELARESLNELLMIYGNWRSRLIRPCPRAVHWSSKLAESAAANTHSEALNSITSDLQHGRDVSPHLSRLSKVAYVPILQRKKLHQRHDLDLLLAEWQIHHLHLSTHLGGRTSDLLFAHITRDDAYLIGVFDHRSWARQEVIEIMVREWPVCVSFHKSRSGITLDTPVRDAERLTLRQGGITTLVEVDGAIIMPGLGMSTAGTAMADTQHANNFTRTLAALRADLAGVLTDLDARYPEKSSEDTTWISVVENDSLWFQRGDVKAWVANLSRT